MTLRDYVAEASVTLSSVSRFGWSHAAVSSSDWKPPQKRIPAARKKAIASSLIQMGLFDRLWYSRVQPKNVSSQDALEHFVDCGIEKGVDPHPLFCGRWYAAQANIDIDTHPIEHFLEIYNSNYLGTHPLFDIDFYVAGNSEYMQDSRHPLLHFLASDYRGRDHVHPLFDRKVFEQGLPQALQGQNLGLLEYVTQPQLAYVSPYLLFDPQYYLTQKFISLPAGWPPLAHYLDEGWRMGLDPSPIFSERFYKHGRPSIWNTPSLLAYENTIPSERGSPHPLFDSSFYKKCHPDIFRLKIDPYEHFITFGCNERREISETFPMDEFIEFRRRTGKGRSTYTLLCRVVQDPVLFWNVFPQASNSNEQKSIVYKSGFSSGAKPKEYALPEALQDYLSIRYSEGDVSIIHILMNIIDKFALAPDEFLTAEQLPWLLGEIARNDAVRSHEKPKLSIIIPVHNNVVYTLTCIFSIIIHSPNTELEIIVGDDASTDITARVLEGLCLSVRVIHHNEALGFIGNCNTTAAYARGDMIVFLNNDTLVLPGWADELATILADPTIGLVGSKLLNPDGTLQEAGGIVWSDGSAWNFGRGQDPGAPEYNYVKEVDYCSGASLAVSMTVWNQLGGFNPLYTPAYNEDSDLAFRVRQLGLRTMYTPFSEVIHHEGRSHGTDATQGIKAYQEVNRTKFTNVWEGVLASEHFPNGVDVAAARDRSREKPHILVVDHYIPQYDRDAGSRTMTSFLESLVRLGWQVSFWPHNLHEDRWYIKRFQALGIEVLYGPKYVEKFDQYLEFHGSRLSTVMLSRPSVARAYLSSPQLRRRRILYYGHDLHWLRMATQRRHDPNSVSEDDIARARASEEDVLRRCNLVLYPTDDECRVVADSLGDQAAVRAIPAYSFSVEALQHARTYIRPTKPEDQRLIFVGGFTHTPNCDAAIWLVRDILPRVIGCLPSVELDIVGSNPPEVILALQGANVRVHSNASDAVLGTLYDRAALAVIPLRYGGGIKGKLIEAFAKAVPVVTTRVGLQGIADAPSYAFYADDAAGFAAQIIRAILDPDLAKAKSERAIGFLEEHFAESVLDARMSEYLSSPLHAQNPKGQSRDLVLIPSIADIPFPRPHSRPGAKPARQDAERTPVAALPRQRKGHRRPIQT